MKSRLFSFFVSASAFSLLLACKSIKVDSTGALPPEAAARLMEYRGSYTGTLSLKSFQTPSRILQREFTVDFDVRDQRPLLSTPKDILGEGCDSHLGRLLDLRGGGVWKAIATFTFDPGKCPGLVQGRTAVLYLGDHHALISIFKDTLPAKSSHGSPRPREYQIEIIK